MYPVHVRVLPWYLLCSLGILGDNLPINTHEPKRAYIGISHRGYVGRGTSNYPLREGEKTGELDLPPRMRKILVTTRMTRKPFLGSGIPNGSPLFAGIDPRNGAQNS